MDPEAIGRALGALTLTAALGFAVLAFVFDIVRSAKSENRRADVMQREHDRQIALVIAEREEWKGLYQAEVKKREDSDERLERITGAFETAFAVVSGGKQLELGGK